MLDHDESLIRLTWTRAGAHTPAIAAAFTRCLEQRHPRLARLLCDLAPDGLEFHVQRFADAAAATLGEPRHLLRLLRHAAGAPAATLCEDDYLVLGDCFLAAMQGVLGERLGSAERVAWQEAITLTAALMARLVERNGGCNEQKTLALVTPLPPRSGP